ncbi:MAG: C39 family peptidase [Nitrososphaerota archaeon]|jgi:ABC-type bacteriocin/lantibiotic exporter with double-glycine peptidase domain|nr:C39 family peptidase [Nitrososphaerota archaeon]
MTSRSDKASLLERYKGELDVAKYKQRKANTCGPASLRIALKLLGLEVDEAWLAGHMAVTKLGTKPSGFKRVLCKLGLSYSEIHNATINDIRRFILRGLPVVVAWTFKGDGHYSLVTGATCEGISIFEPYSGRLIEIDYRRFAKLWHDPCNHTTKWMIAIISNQHEDVSNSVLGTTSDKSN